MLIWNTVCRVKVRRKRCVEQRSKTNGALCRVRKIKALRALRGAFVTHYSIVRSFVLPLSVLPSSASGASLALPAASASFSSRSRSPLM